MSLSSEKDLATLRYTSPLADSPFSLGSDDIKQYYFGSAESEEVSGVELVAETNVSTPLVKEFWAFMDRDGNKTLDPGEYQYKVWVFVSRDAGYLKEAFTAAEPLSNEICLFLEDNSKDLFSGRTAYIAVGDDFKNELEGLREKAARFDGEQMEIISLINQNDQGYSLDFTGAEISELIRTGRIEDPSMEFLATFLMILNWQTVLLSGAYSLVGDGILAVTEFLRDKVKFKEKHWDSSKAGYSPILTHYSNLAVNSFESLSEDLIEDISRTIRAEIDSRKRDLESYVRTAMSKSYAAVLVQSEDITYILDSVFAKVDIFAAELTAKVEAAVGALADVGEQVISAINAYFCGLWNALVEAVLGLIDLLGWIFVALGAAGEAIKNAATVIPEALEILDEMVQTVLSADISGIFSEAIDTIVEEVSSFNLSALTADITLDKVAYMVGAIVGFIVELVVGLISSGGMSSVSSLLTKMGKIGEDVLAFLKASINTVLGGITKFSIETILPIIRKIISVLRGGRAAIRTAIREIFLVIEKAATLGMEYIAEVAGKIGTTSSKLKSWLDDIGMALVKTAEDGCAICKIRT
ncbi:MAG: hypothetical protein H6779_00985 [Candidatus Nomurabacteria bacterium]|nr:hypothetical protein [Candidatus Nomurabacteria bacterium]USN88005.1 MAG: hypothetical protein H6779_00985 [Candidatus Nomurabacteria bacterium]